MIILLLIYLLLIIFIFFSTFPFFDCIAFLPKDIYYCTNLNKFGCIILSIFLILLNPIAAIIQLFSYLFHVGRK